jgi:hypothetical protein
MPTKPFSASKFFAVFRQSAVIELRRLRRIIFSRKNFCQINHRRR